MWDTNTDNWGNADEGTIPSHSGYRRYLYHQGNEKATGGTVEAAAKPWLIPAGKYFAAHRPQGQHPLQAIQFLSYQMV